VLRVRFAPSPTGFLHIGGARTALFNWLFAKKENGKFILRIEDTDTERNDDSYIEQILESMKWLGLTWDEGPFFQSKRMDIYSAYVERLLLEDKAYPCFCRSHELRDPCRFLSAEQRNNFIKKGTPAAIRFKVPDNKTISYTDLVHGEVTFNTSNIEDFVIVRSDGFPTYNYTVVIDDADFKITHIIRGNDHISNTPKQILLYEALGFPVPKFAHIPMVMGPDGKRLSKRHGATAVSAFAKDGILPQTLISYLATLGFSTTDSDIFMDVTELIENFDVSRISKTSAIFDYEKLNWLNGQFYKLLPQKEKEDYFKKILKHRVEDDIIPSLVNACGDRIKSAKDVIFYCDFLFSDAQFSEMVFRKKVTPELTAALIPKIVELLKNTAPFDEENLNTELRALADKENVKFVAIAQIIRFAITKKLQSFGLFDLLIINGQNKTISDLNALLSYTKKHI